ncbi:hypothetical protein ACA910_004984 [Epithemia clementina (nom. ined.)]
MMKAVIPRNPYLKTLGAAPSASKQTASYCAEEGTVVVHHLHLHVTFDGGSRGNPGIAGSGALVTCLESLVPFKCIETSDKNILEWNSPVVMDPCDLKKLKVANIREYLGDYSTNNQAEYNGLCSGLLQAKKFVQEITSKSKLDDKENQGPATSWHVHLLVQGDSELVIKQLHRMYKCTKPWLQDYLTRAECYMDSIQSMEGVCGLERIVQHIPRAKNFQADKLANEAMNEKRSWTTYDCGEHSAAMADKKRARTAETLPRTTKRRKTDRHTNPMRQDDAQKRATTVVPPKRPRRGRTNVPCKFFPRG